MTRPKVYLCDFFHNYLGTSTSMFPLNIGFVAAYAHKHMPNELDITLFKYPAEFVAQCKREMPDAVGFSDYTWSADINGRMSEWVKKRAPNALVVFGGPNITHSPLGYRRFFETHPFVDFNVPYQGEPPFVTLMKAYLDAGKDVDRVRQTPLDGVLAYDRAGGTVVTGKEDTRLKELDSIPSPYLTGLLDPFFETFLIPIVETNRGCPYKCTFCAQGESSFNSLAFFSMDRVKEELNYIADRVKNTNILNLADANFGIVKRDMDIARFISDMTKDRRYPRKFNTNWAKNQSKLFEMAKILNNCNIVVSLQSLDNTVLENVKRSNIKLEIFREIIDKVNAAKGMTGTEIILGLPGEDVPSHLTTLRTLFDWGVSYIICYNALILEGTEMQREREQGIFKPKTKFRLIDNSYGLYDEVLSFEAEEGIRTLDTMTEEEMLSFRPVHWLIQYLWNYRFHYSLLKYVHAMDINPLDFILKLLELAPGRSTPESVRRIFEEFKKEAAVEWFDSAESLREYYSQPEVFRRLQEGAFGKMNGKYIFKMLTEAKEDFENFVYLAANEMLPAKKQALEDLMEYERASVINVDDLDSAPHEKTLRLHYDIQAWRDGAYHGDLEQYRVEGGLSYRFHLPDDQKLALQKLIRQYAHQNRNVTLRKMSEFMDIRDLFYRIEPLSRVGCSQDITA